MDVLVSTHKKKKAVLSAVWRSGMVKTEDGWKVLLVNLSSSESASHDVR